MRLARSILVLVRIVTNNGWHTQPFEDTPNALTLTSECHPLGPPGPIGALLPQDPFQGSPMPTLSIMSQP
jgi:hypothetical protein